MEVSLATLGSERCGLAAIPNLKSQLSTFLGSLTQQCGAPFPR